MNDAVGSRARRVVRHRPPLVLGREASGARLSVGRLIVIGEPVRRGTSTGQTVEYAGVSSAGQRPDLDRQVARATAWATGQRLPVERVVTDLGSAVNGHRRRFLALLRDPAVSTIVVEHRDRFARFGAEYVEASPAASGRGLLVVDPAEVDPS